MSDQSCPGTGGPPDQYGRAPYGDPQYPTTAYGPQEFSPCTGAAPADNGGGARKGVWMSAVVAVLAAAGVGAYFLFSGSNASASPADPVKALFEAGKTGDVTTARKVLCRADIAAGAVGSLANGGRVKTYRIGEVSQKNSTHATVSATLTTADTSRSVSANIPVVEESGSWKVCFTENSTGAIVGGVSSRSATGPAVPVPIPSLSIPSIPVPSVSLPSIPVPPVSLPSIPALGNFCATSVSAFTTAATYIGAIEIGSDDLAQGCVYKNSVPKSVTDELGAGNKFYVPTNSAGGGPVFNFVTIDRSSTVKVIVTKESDGKYYVTRVHVG
jgi:hypothetical protein